MMRTKENKKGISLIVLIITIIVVIILTAVVILTLSKNNPIDSAKEARFKEDVRTFQDELALAVSKEYANAGGHRDEKITTSDFEKIKEYIPSFSEKYKDKFVIEDDELKYTNVADQEKEWCDSLYIKNGLTYTKLEYIESTGEQWIDTGYKPNNNTRIIAKMSFLKLQNNTALFGTRTKYDDMDQFSLVQVGNETNIRTDFYNNVRYSIRKTTEPLEIDKNKNTITINNNTSFNDYGEFISKYNLLIFAMNDRGIKSWLADARLEYLKIYDEDKLIRDYIPVLDPNNKPALYDKVEGKFYYNQGTGEDFKYKLKE